MSIDDALVHPLPGKYPPNIGKRCAMAATLPDFRDLARLMGGGNAQNRNVMLSRLIFGPEGKGPAVIGPFIGAPYAVMLLETLITWGVREVVVLGWCGALSSSLAVGDVLLPAGAIAGDGASPHYLAEGAAMSVPDGDLQERLTQTCRLRDIPCHAGLVWTTDAIFRETPGQVRLYQAKGATAVDMETAALFAAAAFRHVRLGCLLVVSDTLSSLAWKPGFQDPLFCKRRGRICRLIMDLWP